MTENLLFIFYRENWNAQIIRRIMNIMAIVRVCACARVRMRVFFGVENASELAVNCVRA